jgi:hypothetical protein
LHQRLPLDREHPEFVTFPISLPNSARGVFARVPLEQAFNVVSIESKAPWTPVTENIILVFPDQAQKRHDYEQQVIRTFYRHRVRPPPKRAIQAQFTQFTGEELQVKFLSDSEENSLKY